MCMKTVIKLQCFFFTRFADRLLDREHQMVQASMKTNEKLSVAINVSMNNPK